VARRLFITGGWGYLGRAVVKAATGAGWLVFEPRHDELDIRDEYGVRAAITAARPDVVIHTAYRKAGPEMWSTNVDGATTVARTATSAGARFIHVSSDQIFAGRTTPYDERAEPSPINDYGRSKAAAEKAVALVAPGAAIIRTSILYDPEQVGPANGVVLEAARGTTATTTEFFVDEFRSFTPVHDLASSMMDLCFHDYAGPLNIAGPEPLSRYDFACRLARHRGLDSFRLVPTLLEERHGPRPAKLILDSSKSAGLLTTRVRPVAEVLGI
jgi:dTDP-4-dehydrorhamnose reductase